MIPNFALSLSFEGLRLMHRVDAGWHDVGQVALDDSDLTGSLSRLRDAALELEPSGISTKLLIPNDQIKYIALDTTRAEDEDVRDALHGATPYSVQELSYDFVKGGGRTYVAAVAKETLEEARQFASEHGFNPVSFAAVPEPFTYVGEAFFGATTGNTAERDTEAVVVTGTSAAAIIASPAVEPEDLVASPDSDTADVASPDDTVGEPSGDDAMPAAEPEDHATEDAQHDDSGPDSSVVDDPVAQEPVEDGLAPDAAEDSGGPSDDMTSEAEAENDDSAPDAAVEDTPTEATSEGSFEEDPPAEPSETDDMPVFGSLRADRNEGRPAPTQDEPAFSRRAEPTFARETPPPLAVPTDTGTTAAPSLSASRDPAPAAPAPAPVTTETPLPDAAPPITGEAPNVVSPDVAAASLTIEPEPVEEPEPLSDHKSGSGTALGAVGGAVGGMFASRRMTRSETTSDDKATEETPRKTVFGARKQPKPKPVVGGKPRYLGLILTAILLVFLLAMAAFAALSEEGFARWFGFGNEDTQIADTPETPMQTAPEPEVIATPDDALDAPAIVTGGTVLTPEEAMRIYATTGVWQRAPRIPLIPRTTNIEGLLLDVTMSPVVRVPASPLADASSVAGDALIATPIDPPPPSATFEFGDDGLILATESGAVTPDGTLVIAGRPPLEPPARPGTVAPEITPQDQLAAVIPETATPLPDAPEGVIVILGAPSILPPARTVPEVPEVPEVAVTEDPVVPDSPPEQSAEDLAAAALAAVETPDVLSAPVPDVLPESAPEPQPEGLNVIAGAPPVLPPVRPGTTAPALAPDLAPELAPIVDPEVAATAPITPPTDPVTPDASEPEGLNVIAGSPPVLPPARPGTRAPQDEAALESLSEDVSTALLAPDGNRAQTPAADTPRPLNRPDSVVAAAAVVQTPPVDTALAGFRPTLRPAGLAPEPAPEPEEPVVAEAPAPTPTLQISPEIAAAVQAAANRPNPIVNPTAQAIAVSSRPDPRPRNMSRIVDRANQEAARAATQVAAAPQQVAPRTVRPNGPTAGSVAQNATLENAINLRRVNLIGIYGSSSDRRALVRLGNGRYVRVNVGDRLDGGRVTAISANALSYTKRGSAITLEVAG